MALSDDISAGFRRIFSGPTGAYMQKRKDEEEGRDYGDIAASGVKQAAGAVSDAVAATAANIARGPVTRENMSSGAASDLINPIPTPEASNNITPTLTGNQPTNQPSTGGVETDDITKRAVEAGDQIADRTSSIANFLADAQSENPSFLNEPKTPTEELAAQTNKLAGQVDRYKELGKEVGGVASMIDFKPRTQPTNEGEADEPTYESSMAEFKEKFGDTVRGSLRPKEGETGDQFQARLKERAALKRRIAKLRPEEEEKNIVQKGLDFVKDLGARFAERRQESPTGRQQEPSEASRQTPTAATQQPAVPDSDARLTGRREFAKDIARAGGYGNLSGSQKDRAVALGLKRADINKFFERQETRQANARPRLQGARGVEGATGRLGEKRSLGRNMGEDVAFVQTPSQDEERRRRRLTPAQILNAYRA